MPRDHFLRHEQPELDADACKANPFAAALRARCNIVVSGELTSLHATPVIDNRQSCVSSVG
jgi:hypothetical protein